MLSLAAIALFLFASVAILAGKLWIAVLSGALGGWLAKLAMERRDDMELMFGLFLMAVVAGGIIRAAYALLP